jgi:uncharacterized membrane protein
LKITESIEINTTPEKIFAVYKDVKNWTSWDKNIISAELNGDFKVGTKGVLTPIKGPEVKIKITKIEENKFLTMEATPPLAKITFEHILEPWSQNTTKVTHQVTFSGLSGAVFANMIGDKIAKKMPEVLKSLKNKLESN